MRTRRMLSAIAAGGLLAAVARFQADLAEQVAARDLGLQERLATDR